MKKSVKSWFAATLAWPANRLAAAAVLLMLCLVGISPRVEAGVVFNGWNAGVSSARFNWSSDLFNPVLLGLPDQACVYPNATLECSRPGQPHGTTTPGDLPPYSLIAGQQVQTRVSRSIGGPMLASLTADVQQAGDIEGQITHFRFENAVSTLSPYGYGLFSYADALSLFFFGGIGASTSLYYYLEWMLDADATGPGPLMDYSVEINGRNPAFRASGITPQDLSGSYAGSVTGVSALSPMFHLYLASPAGTSHRANATLDIWMTFSASPIFDLPRDDHAVPEPGTLSLLLGAGLLLVARRGVGRRRAHRRAASGGATGGSGAAPVLL